MEIKDIVAKFWGKKVSNNPNVQRTPMLSAEERELMRYKEKDRQLQIRAELSHYRKRASQDLFQDTMGQQSRQINGDPKILKAKDCFNTKRNNNLIKSRGDLL